MTSVEQQLQDLELGRTALPRAARRGLIVAAGGAAIAGLVSALVPSSVRGPDGVFAVVAGALLLITITIALQFSEFPLMAASRRTLGTDPPVAQAIAGNVLQRAAHPLDLSEQVRALDYAVIASPLYLIRGVVRGGRAVGLGLLALGAALGGDGRAAVFVVFAAAAIGLGALMGGWMITVGLRARRYGDTHPLAGEPDALLD